MVEVGGMTMRAVQWWLCAVACGGDACLGGVHGGWVNEMKGRGRWINVMKITKRA